MKTQKDCLKKTKYVERTGYGDGTHVKIEPMPRTKVKGFLEEFSPWLDRYMRLFVFSPQYSVGQYYTSKIESSLLEYKPQRKNTSWNPFKPNWVTEQIVLVNEKESSFYGVAPPHLVFVMENETIDEAIKRHDCPDNITHILSYWEYTDAAIIYKSPAGISVPKWIEQQIADEKAKIHAEVKAIDAEYVAPKKPTPPPCITRRDGEKPKTGEVKKPKSRRLRKEKQLKRVKDLFDCRNLKDWFL